MPSEGVMILPLQEAIPELVSDTTIIEEHTGPLGLLDGMHLNYAVV